ncbi:MAG: hypothetical protein ACKV2V_24840 [Blastocatellia bacterium]
MQAPLTIPGHARVISANADRDLYAGTHTCSPLLLHELLKSTALLSPSTYDRILEEGFSVERSKLQVQQSLRGGLITNAWPTIRLSRLITSAPHGYEIFGLSGINMADDLRDNILPHASLAIGMLPRTMRIRAAILLIQKHKHHFSGSRSLVDFVREGDHLYVGITDSVFSGREDTQIGGGELHRQAIETIFREYAHVQCRVLRTKPRRQRLNEVWFEIVSSKS